MDHFLLFVEAAQLIFSTHITRPRLEEAGRLLVTFCGGMNGLYNASAQASNVHFLLHTMDVVNDFGGVYNSSTFNYERYNKIVKNISTNSRLNFEKTYLRKFLFTVHGAKDFLEPKLGYNIQDDDVMAITLKNLFNKEDGALVANDVSMEPFLGEAIEGFSLDNFVKLALDPDSVFGNEVFTSHNNCVHKVIH